MSEFARKELVKCKIITQTYFFVSHPKCTAEAQAPAQTPEDQSPPKEQNNCEGLVEMFFELEPVSSQLDKWRRPARRTELSSWPCIHGVRLWLKHFAQMIVSILHLALDFLGQCTSSSMPEMWAPNTEIRWGFVLELQVTITKNIYIRTIS